MYFTLDGKNLLDFDGQTKREFLGNYWRDISIEWTVYIKHYFVHSVEFCVVRFSVPNNVNVLFRTILRKFSCLTVLNIFDRICHIYLFLFFDFPRLKNKVTQWKSLTGSFVLHKMPVKDWKARYLYLCVIKRFLAKNVNHGSFIVRRSEHICKVLSSHCLRFSKRSHSCIIIILFWFSLFPSFSPNLTDLPCFCCSSKRVKWVEMYEFCVMRVKKITMKVIQIAKAKGCWRQWLACYRALTLCCWTIDWNKSSIIIVWRLCLSITLWIAGFPLRRQYS